MSAYEKIVGFLSSNAGAIAILIITYWLVLTYMRKTKRNLPPGPTGFPILGVALSIGKRPEKTFRKWARKYGDIMGFKIGGSYTVVLSSYDEIYDALVKNAFVFNNRPDNPIFMDDLHKSGLTGSDYTDDYVIQRKFAHKILAKLGFGKKTMETPILYEAQHLVARLGKGKIELDTKAQDNIKFAIGNVLAQVAFGERFNDITNPCFTTIIKALDAFFNTGAKAFNAATISPLLLHLPGIRESAKSVKDSVKEYLAAIRKIINDHRETFDSSNPRDFIDEYFIEQMKNGNEQIYTETMLEHTVVDIFGAGTQTTTDTLIFALLVLANRPTIVKKIHEEIDDVLGSDGKPHYTQKEKLPFCNAVIKEILRLRSIVPLAVPHAVHKDIYYKGYFIPKGSTILLNIYAVHSNPKHWKEPERFDPSRFINDAGKVETGKFFMPFGIGPRACIGRALAEMQLFIFLVTLLQHFDVVPTPTEGCDHPLVLDDVEKTGITANPPKDTNISLITRHI